MRSTRHKILIALGALLVALVLFPIIEHYRGKRALERWEANMTARGEKIRIEELIPPPPAAEDNGFADVLFASGRLRGSPRLAGFMPPTLRFVAPGKAIYIIGQTRWKGWSSGGGPTKDTNVTWEVFVDEMASLTEPLNAAKAALKKPALEANPDYRFGMTLALSHLAPLRRVGQCLTGAVLLDLRRGDLLAAAENLEALLALSRGWQDERLVISQVVRIAITTIAVGATWQALHTVGWNDDQLARLQAGWRSLQFLDAMGHALEMERAMQRAEYNRLLAGHQSIYQYMSGSSGAGATSVSSLDDVVDLLRQKLPQYGVGALYGRFWQYAWLQQDELHCMELMQATIETGRRAAAEKSGANVAAAIQRTEVLTKEVNVYDRLRFYLSEVLAPSLSKSVQRASICETLRELTVTAIALKRYELRHGKPAAKLAVLVPDILPELPRDYMDGQPLRYRLNPDGSFVLYSVGQDGRDDGGDATPAKTDATTFNLQNGRDIIWPAPALAEEIAAAEAKAAKRN